MVRIFLLLPILLLSCDVKPIIASIEVATKTVDRSLNNTVRANSVVELSNEVYFGGVVLRKLQGEEWVIENSPAGSENPTLDLIAFDGSLWLATNKAILHRKSTGWEREKSLNSPLFGRVFLTANSEIFAFDDALYHREAENDWKELFKERPSRVLFQAPNYYFLTQDKIYVKDANVQGSVIITPQLSGLGDGVELSMSDLIFYKNNFYLASNGRMYRSSTLAANSTWQALDSVRGRSMTIVEDLMLVYGGFLGYAIWDGSRWLTNKNNDDFTDVDSLLVNVSDTPVHQQPLAKMTYLENSKRLYAIPFGAQGLYSAEKDGNLWKWARE